MRRFPRSFFFTALLLKSKRRVVSKQKVNNVSFPLFGEVSEAVHIHSNEDFGIEDLVFHAPPPASLRRRLPARYPARTV